MTEATGRAAQTLSLRKLPSSSRNFILGRESTVGNGHHSPRFFLSASLTSFITHDFFIVDLNPCQEEEKHLSQLLKVSETKGPKEGRILSWISTVLNAEGG